MENVIGVAMIILNIIGVVWLGIKLGHPVLISIGYIIALVIIGKINEMACIIVALAVAAIVLIVIIVTVVKAIIEKKWLKELARKNTDLVNAINRSDKQAVQAIIENGAYIDYIDYNNYSRYPLQIAIENSDKEMVAFLIEKGANVNLICGEKAPLDFAKGDEMITLLKRHGAKTKFEIDAAIKQKIDKQDMLNNDLFVTINNHDREKAEFMISQGADVNVSDLRFQGLTPLLCAIFEDDIEMVKLLLKHGADARQQVHLIGGGGVTTAVQYARGLGKQDIADLLEYA